MTIRTLEQTAAQRVQALPLSALSGFVIGIEARHFLQRLLTIYKEPLVPALGGSPFALKTHIENELEKLKTEGIMPLFVFSGMDIVDRGRPNRGLEGSNPVNAEAWKLYDLNEAESIVPTFTKSDSTKPENYYFLLQKTLHSHGIDFLVAPYGASAQLAYLQSNPKSFVDAIVGSLELFLFDVDKVITNIDFERSQFSWISKQSYLNEDLRKVSESLFIDACLLCGTSFLPTFPPLESLARGKQVTVQDALSMITETGRSVVALCDRFEGDAQVQKLNYLDNFRRARLAIRHHIVLNDEGEAVVLNSAKAPSDMHEFIGQRLPDELYFYLSRGLISPRVPNWLISGEVREAAPLDGGESKFYRALVQKQLAPFRQQALSLLSQPLHRYYYSREKDIKQRLWFDGEFKTILDHKALNPAPHGLSANWHVRESAFSSVAHDTQNADPGSLRFAFDVLADQTSAPKLVAERNKSEPLTSATEIVCNTTWRVLELRGYINEKHVLTSWGNAYKTGLAMLDPQNGLEESLFLALEFVRLGLLTGDNMFPLCSGAPTVGSDADKKYCLLISRVACLGYLRHKPVGYNGPLNRQLLAFNSTTEVVRQALRDLMETSLVSLLLNGDADRDQTDWNGMGLKLPFSEPRNCGLGVAVTMYLDQLARETDTSSEQAHESVKSQVVLWLNNSEDIKGDLDIAFKFWKSVVEAVKAGDSSASTKESFLATDKWLQPRI